MNIRRPQLYSSAIDEELFEVGDLISYDKEGTARGSLLIVLDYYIYRSDSKEMVCFDAYNITLDSYWKQNIDQKAFVKVDI